MINPYDLINKFKYALDERWGYIWGTSGQLWTSAKQEQKIAYMVSTYGKNWKKIVESKQDTYYYAALYGAKWINHYVADCSGLFRWAFKELGYDIAHGSNSIYDRYCTEKGKLNDSLKKTLLPGTAVFTGDANSHGHIGLYVGNGKVIEASGTQAGVCTSNLSAGKWTYYGLLKNVDYTIAQTGEIPTQSDILKSTLRKGDKGSLVKEMQERLLELGYSLPKYGADGSFGNETLTALKAFQKDRGLVSDGVCGKDTWEQLLEDEKRVTVVIPDLLEATAKQLIEKYNGAYIKEGE